MNDAYKNDCDVKRPIHDVEPCQYLSAEITKLFVSIGTVGL